MHKIWVYTLLPIPKALSEDLALNFILGIPQIQQGAVEQILSLWLLIDFLNGIFHSMQEDFIRKKYCSTILLRGCSITWII